MEFLGGCAPLQKLKIVIFKFNLCNLMYTVCLHFHIVGFIIVYPTDFGPPRSWALIIRYTDNSQWPRILERGITLIHPYSRNKSNKEDRSSLILILNFMISREIIAKNIRLCLQLLLLTIFSIFSLKNTLQNKSRTKNLWSQTYSGTEFIPLSSIRAIVLKCE